jgi:hypothetical protein
MLCKIALFPFLISFVRILCARCDIQNLWHPGELGSTNLWSSCFLQKTSKQIQKSLQTHCHPQKLGFPMISEYLFLPELIEHFFTNTIFSDVWERCAIISIIHKTTCHFLALITLVTIC